MTLDWRAYTYIIRIAVLGGLLISGGLRVSTAAAPPSGCDAINFDQGWTHEQSQEFWFTPQGSHLMPYSWFMALEVSDPTSQALFHDRSNMDRYDAAAFSRALYSSRSK